MLYLILWLWNKSVYCSKAYVNGFHKCISAHELVELGGEGLGWDYFNRKGRALSGEHMKGQLRHLGALMTDWAALFWPKSSFNMHDKRRPSGTFPGSSTKSLDNCCCFYRCSSSCHHQRPLRLCESIKVSAGAKSSAFHEPSSVLKISALHTQWVQNKRGRQFGCWAC